MNFETRNEPVRKPRAREHPARGGKLPENKKGGAAGPPAAPPRLPGKKGKRRPPVSGALLSHGRYRSTIGARRLSFRVRNGSGRAPPAMAADRWAALVPPTLG